MGKIHERIKWLRNKKDWTQTELANQMGTSTRTIMRLEGEQNLTLSQINQLSQIFETSISFLVGESENPENPKNEKKDDKAEGANKLFFVERLMRESKGLEIHIQKKSLENLHDDQVRRIADCIDNNIDHFIMKNDYPFYLEQQKKKQIKQNYAGIAQPKETEDTKDSQDIKETNDAEVARDETGSVNLENTTDSETTEDNKYKDDDTICMAL